MAELDETHVVTCFLRNRGEVLLLRRSEAVGSYRGSWGGVAGHVEDDPEASARREIAEETALLEACTLVRRGDAFHVDDEELGKRWVVHPFLFDCESRDAQIDWESVEAEWVAPPQILRRETVPRLWTSYRHVAPSVASVADDREHGSAWLSLRALEVLRDAAASQEREADRDGDRQETGTDPDASAWDELASLARDLIQARPAMTALHNRVHRAMHRSGGRAAAVERVAQEELLGALDADRDAAHAAADMLGGKSVFTMSRSGTVRTALVAAEAQVTVAVSEPLGEGIEMAEQLAAAGLAVMICPDAAAAHVLHSGAIDAVLIGADTVSSDGGVMNKIGTHLVALAARAAGVPLYVVAARDKIAPPSDPDPEEQTDRSGPAEPRVDRSAVYGGEADVGVVDVLFEWTPAELIAGVIVEGGPLDAAAVTDVAARHAALRDWLER